MTLVVVCLLLVNQLSAADAGTPAPPPAELHQQIDTLLRTRDVPVTAQQWRALGPAALPELERLAADRSELPTRRARALEGVVAIGSRRAPKLVVRLAQAEEEPFVVRMAAIRGTGRTLSASRQLVALQPVLEGARDPALRGVTADVLSRHSSACPVVAAQAQRETDDWRTRFHTAVSRCAMATR
jgi:HEAT repeat protein